MDVTVDGQPYQLFTDGEWAWPGSAEDDAALLAAMKNGTTAVMTAFSAESRTLGTFNQTLGDHRLEWEIHAVQRTGKDFLSFIQFEESGKTF